MNDAHLRSLIQHGHLPLNLLLQILDNARHSDAIECSVCKNREESITGDIRPSRPGLLANSHHFSQLQLQHFFQLLGYLFRLKCNRNLFHICSINCALQNRQIVSTRFISISISGGKPLLSLAISDA